MSEARIGTNTKSAEQGGTTVKGLFAPLKDIDKGGFNVGKAWAQGMTKGDAHELYQMLGLLVDDEE